MSAIPQVTKVSRFQASDGSTHNSHKEALVHSKKIVRSGRIADLLLSLVDRNNATDSPIGGLTHAESVYDIADVLAEHGDALAVCLHVSFGAPRGPKKRTENAK